MENRYAETDTRNEKVYAEYLTHKMETYGITGDEVKVFEVFKKRNMDSILEVCGYSEDEDEIESAAWDVFENDYLSWLEQKRNNLI